MCFTRRFWWDSSPVSSEHFYQLTGPMENTMVSTGKNFLYRNHTFAASIRQPFIFSLLSKEHLFSYLYERNNQHGRAKRCKSFDRWRWQTAIQYCFKPMPICFVVMLSGCSQSSYEQAPIDSVANLDLYPRVSYVDCPHHVIRTDSDLRCGVLYTNESYGNDGNNARIIEVVFAAMPTQVDISRTKAGRVF